MSVAEPIDPLDNVAHAVSCVKQSPPGQRKKLVETYLRGQLDYSSDTGRTIGNRRVEFCTRLREEELWPK